MIPQRIQRQRTKGWRKPEGAVYVGRGSKWGNPYVVGKTQVRMPASDGGDWEREGRLHKRSGEQHAFFHPGSTYEAPIITMHQVEDATAEQCVAMYRSYVTGAFDLIRYRHEPMVEDIRTELAGKDLMCWCPLSQPCHADVLLELANGDRLPVGTPVLFWPGARVGEGRRSATRTPIWKMGDGTEVVSVEGYPGGIALTHIQTLPVGATTTGLDQTPSTTPEARS
ncbi:DUF4326 domain-containing protein [Arthrobacter sp. G119Y2]|uniref:DUF4326 domain-containing protein n=1 Tax=Arthrobacter sp. G119Y2 TaxID=3134965 RepID=UPI0031196153